MSTKFAEKAKAKLSNSPILEALWRVIRYHTGTVAFGALVMLPVRIIQGIVTYLQAKTQGSDNAVAKCVLCCAQCCVSCCKCLVNTIAKQGFVFTMIYGTNFCYSGVAAIKLLWHNIARTAAVESISSYMEIFGRLCIMALTTGICAIIMDEYSYYEKKLSSLLLPCLAIAVISYVIASFFMMVFEVAVDTVFLCFLVDEQAHGGRAKFIHDESKLLSMAGSDDIKARHGTDEEAATLNPLV